MWNRNRNKKNTDKNKTITSQARVTPTTTSHWSTIAATTNTDGKVQPEQMTKGNPWLKKLRWIVVDSLSPCFRCSRNGTCFFLLDGRWILELATWTNNKKLQSTLSYYKQAASRNETDLTRRNNNPATTDRKQQPKDTAIKNNVKDKSYRSHRDVQQTNHKQ